MRKIPLKRLLLAKCNCLFQASVSGCIGKCIFTKNCACKVEFRSTLLRNISERGVGWGQPK